MTELLSTTSLLENYVSSMEPRQHFFRHLNNKDFTSTTSAVTFFSSSEESSPRKYPPRILAGNFDIHQGILSEKFSFTDGGQGVFDFLNHGWGWFLNQNLRIKFRNKFSWILVKIISIAIQIPCATLETIVCESFFPINDLKRHIKIMLIKPK